MKQQPTTATSKRQDKATAEVLKIGIDMHKSKYVVVCQIDGEGPKAPQSFSPEAFFAWVAKRIKHTDKAYSCYVAGYFGCVAHRRLEALGVANFVVRPRNWDEYGLKVKTDTRDARELCSCLDRFPAGNDQALTPVRIPSEQEERSRSLSRQRDTLRWFVLEPQEATMESGRLAMNSHLLCNNGL